MAGRVTTEEDDEPEKQRAVVLEDSLCAVNAELRLYEGDVVVVECMLPELSLYQCRLGEQTGLFPASSLKIIKRRSGGGESSTPLRA